MSKDIDFEFGRSIGATHYRKIDSNPYVDWYKESDGDVVYWSHSKCAWDYGDAWFFDSTKIPPAEPWTIHNNDKPLCELSDEQYGKLRRAAEAGGVVEYMPDVLGWRVVEYPAWRRDGIYRIKPKSEREEFVDQCMNAAHQKPCAYSAIFDAIQRGDIKAPEVRK